jgi:hypothetical protein
MTDAAPQAQQDLEEGALAGPVGSHQADDSRLNVQRQRIQCRDVRAVALGEGSRLNEGHRPILASVAARDGRFVATYQLSRAFVGRNDAGACPADLPTINHVCRNASVTDQAATDITLH